MIPGSFNVNQMLDKLLGTYIGTRIDSTVQYPNNILSHTIVCTNTILTVPILEPVLHVLYLVQYSTVTKVDYTRYTVL